MLQRRIATPLRNSAGYLIRHVSVPGNQGWVDTGVDLFPGSTLYVAALGKWSNSGPPAFGPGGFANTSGNPSTLDPEANIGQLLVLIDASGMLIPFGKNYPPGIYAAQGGHVYLSMNDIPWTLSDNEGSLTVSLMVFAVAPETVTLTVPAAGSTANGLLRWGAGWTNTGIFLAPGRSFYVIASGSWSNVGPPALGPDGFVNYQYPGTVLPSGDLASLIGYVGTSIFPVGSYLSGDYPPGGQLFLGMNDVWWNFGDNQGALRVVVGIGSYSL